MDLGWQLFILPEHYCSDPAVYPKIAIPKRNHSSEQLCFSGEKRSLYLTLLRVWFAVFRRCGIPYRDLRHYCRSGELLPRLFTLTSTKLLRRYFFCGTFSCSFIWNTRMLSGTLFYEVRTFLFPFLSGSNCPVCLSDYSLK